MIFGPQLTSQIIEIKVGLYISDLKDRLESINYSTMTGGEFEALSSEDKSAVYEKHFLEDNLDDFFDQHVKMGSMNTTGYLGNQGEGAGLYGQMTDWWLGTEGADIFKSEIGKSLSSLPQR